MRRLIDANAIDKRYVPIAPVIEGDAVHYEWVAFVEDINKQPTIEAEPVKHGEWILWDGKYDSGYICSRCKRPAGVVEAAEIYKYCPFCGAKMQVRCK